MMSFKLHAIENKEQFLCQKINCLKKIKICRENEDKSSVTNKQHILYFFFVNVYLFVLAVFNARKLLNARKLRLWEIFILFLTQVKGGVRTRTQALHF